MHLTRSMETNFRNGETSGTRKSESEIEPKKSRSAHVHTGDYKAKLAGHSRPRMIHELSGVINKNMVEIIIQWETNLSTLERLLRT